MSRPRTVIATAAAIASLAAVGSPTAQAQEAYDGFESPSGNIVCATDGDTLACDVRNRGRTVAMERYGLPVRYWSNNVLWADAVLPYGYRWRAFGFSCTSQRVGVTCRSHYSGHGFFLSRTRIRTW